MTAMPQKDKGAEGGGSSCTHTSAQGKLMKYYVRVAHREGKVLSNCATVS